MKKRYIHLFILGLVIVPLFCGAVPEATSMDTPAQNISDDGSTNQQQSETVKTLSDVESENNQATINNSSKTQTMKEEIGNIDDAANGLTS
ncbi:hypothetical protein [Francisella sp. XLW-1]|uniref:hypothetical protein n=1 Tax=Francisella sp. XLW-1 TaxID=2610887 RepID=UPI00123D038C|nr:hypothetical protein [Francisella sp. XLW-1]